MGIKASPIRMPYSLMHQKFCGRSFQKCAWSNAKKNIGKKSSFICSQVDSLTPEIRAMSGLCPSQSYKKWSRTPKIPVIINPSHCQRLMVFFIESMPPLSSLLCTFKFTNCFLPSNCKTKEDSPTSFPVIIFLSNSANESSFKDTEIFELDLMA